MEAICFELSIVILTIYFSYFYFILYLVICYSVHFKKVFHCSKYQEEHARLVGKKCLKSGGGSPSPSNKITAFDQILIQLIASDCRKNGGHVQEGAAYGNCTRTE